MPNSLDLQCLLVVNFHVSVLHFIFTSFFFHIGFIIVVASLFLYLSPFSEQHQAGLDVFSIHGYVIHIENFQMIS